MQVTINLANGQEMSIIKHFFLGYFYDLSQYDDQLIINEAGLPMWKPFGLPDQINHGSVVWTKEKDDAYKEDL